ncbi:MAG TPA: hypothetical protein PK453_04175 [Leptospiraceae bacterium]|nr:hypothetical protein [Leptospiraceae bacterium]HNF12842.1 hypothetical protein [Leptospiraceae bacterium]HNF24204.1 hypothetical protein [Leptospiraceae bacterium]HNI97978.1 hypothetical protein [Leptospiraceae bacterium]HNM04283.1 hypothetical protein [Leptospiraceae bacterium]
MLKYLFIDKTGRGFTCNGLTKDDVLKWDDDLDYYTDPLAVWLEDSSEGDEWENAEIKVVCTGEA